MLTSGLLDGQRLELLDGDLINKMGQNPPHAYALHRLLAYFIAVFGVARVRIQSPIQIPGTAGQFSLPEPDLAVLSEETAGNATLYGTRHPLGNELELVVEVADSSLHLDRTTKRGLYADAGVREYWILDLPGKRMLVHRNPLAGEYSIAIAIDGSDTVAPESVPGQLLRISEILPGEPARLA